MQFYMKYVNAPYTPYNNIPYLIWMLQEIHTFLRNEKITLIMFQNNVLYTCGCNQETKGICPKTTSNQTSCRDCLSSAFKLLLGQRELFFITSPCA